MNWGVVVVLIRICGELGDNPSGANPLSVMLHASVGRYVAVVGGRALVLSMVGGPGSFMFEGTKQISASKYNGINKRRSHRYKQQQSNLLDHLSILLVDLNPVQTSWRKTSRPIQSTRT